MRWTVNLEIRIPNGTAITSRGEDLEVVLGEVVQRAIVWFSQNRPDYPDGENPMPMNLKEI